MKKNNTVAVIEKELHPIVKIAVNTKIKTLDDMKVAVEVLSKLNQFNDKITAEKEKITKPLNEALKAERNRWKPLETMYENAIVIVREEMSLYQTRLVQTQKEEEAKIAARVGEGKGKIKIETAIKKMDEVEKPETKIATQAGLVNFREIKRLRITDEKKIPREFLMVDEKKVFDALKAGMTIPGAEIDLVQVPSNYR